MSEHSQIDPRHTQWRQGNFLNKALSAGLGLDPELYHIVITHDCDLAADLALEPFIEVISGEILTPETLNPMHTTGRSPRELHIPCLHFGEKAHVRLIQSRKVAVSKEIVLSANPDSELVTPDDSIKLLRTWLACRYRRHALPNNLNDRLNKVYQKLEDVGKKKHEGVIATFLAYDPGDELDSDEPYEVSFCIVYKHQSDVGKTHAEAMSTALEKALDKTEGVESGSIRVFSDAEFTLFDMTQMIEWRFEHLSFRGAEIGTMVEP